MKKALSVFFICCLVLSCSKKDEVVEPTPSNVDFTPMSVGNYWVYGNFRIDTLGNENQLPRIDSVSITGKEIIRSKTYYVFKGSYYFTSAGENSILWKLRDSSGYLVDTNGRIQFAHNNFSDSLDVYCLVNPRQNDTVYCHAYQLQKSVYPITVPAGTFNALNYQRLITLYGHYARPNVPNPREWDTFYANGVGRILETTFYASQPGHNEIRLLRYRVN